VPTPIRPRTLWCPMALVDPGTGAQTGSDRPGAMGGLVAAQPVEGVGWQGGQADKGVREIVGLVGKGLRRW
jgi:hypothetical protein